MRSRNAFARICARLDIVKMRAGSPGDIAKRSRRSISQCRCARQEMTRTRARNVFLRNPVAARIRVRFDMVRVRTNTQDDIVDTRVGERTRMFGSNVRAGVWNYQRIVCAQPARAQHITPQPPEYLV